MFDDGTAFSSFAVPDTEAARAFYGDTLGLDVRDSREAGLLEKVAVGENETGPLLRHVILEEDRFNRADLGANAAVDALGWIDEVLL